MSDVALIILAGGRGRRMQEDLGNDLPKVLQPLRGQPLVSHLIHSVEDASIQWPPVIVVGYRGDEVEKTLGPDFTYVMQKEQLGTGHATAQARTALEGKAEHVLVLYGDHPHIPLSVVEEIIAAHKDHGNTITLATATVSDFNEWREQLMYYGRVIRNAGGAIQKIVEYKDASSAEREILEVSPSYFCFRAKWLWSHIDLLKNNNAQKEYYLTDLLGMAIEEGERVESVAIDPMVALGANTAEELRRLELLMPKIT